MKLNTSSVLLVAPFSLNSVFKTCDLNLDMRFVLILNYKHVSTAGLTVHIISYRPVVDDLSLLMLNINYTYTLYIKYIANCV